MEANNNFTARPAFEEITDEDRQKGNFLERRPVKKLIASMEALCPKLSELLKNSQWANEGNMIFDSGQKTMKVVSPTLEGLKDRASYYEAKYGISLKVFELPVERELQLEKFKEFISAHKGYVGVICVSKEGNHVLPMILKLEESGPPSALLLDVLGAAEKVHPTPTMRGLLKKSGIVVKECRDARQADALSCRVGALVTLRNALIDLKSGSAAELFEGNSPFSIPINWGYTDQIFRPAGSMEGLPNPRRQKRGENPETISEHTARYRMEVTLEHTLTLPPNQLTRAFKQEDAQLPTNIHMRRAVNGQLSLSWIEKVEVNGYMLQKGHKMANSQKFFR